MIVYDTVVFAIWVYVVSVMFALHLYCYVDVVVVMSSKS